MCKVDVNDEAVGMGFGTIEANDTCDAVYLQRA